MTVGDLITMLRAYPNDDEIEIQVFDPTFSIDIEAEKFRNYIK